MNGNRPRDVRSSGTSPSRSRTSAELTRDSDPLPSVSRTAGFGGLDPLAVSTATTMGDGALALPSEPERLRQEN
jgi:hypothetical protein